MKEVQNHLKHLEITFGRLMDILFSKEELDALASMKSEAPQILSNRSAWIRTSDLAIEDIDPFSGAVLLHLSFKDIEKEKEKENEKELERMKRS